MTDLAPDWGGDRWSEIADGNTDTVALLVILDRYFTKSFVAVMEGINAEVIYNGVEELRVSDNKFVLVAITELEFFW